LPLAKPKKNGLCCRSCFAAFDVSVEQLSFSRWIPVVRLAAILKQGDALMKFLTLYTPDAKKAGIPPSKEHLTEMGQFIEESMKAGILIATGGLLPPAKGRTRLRATAGTIAAIDGPFTESKELIGGFALLEVKSKEEAIEAVTQFLKIMGDGETDMRQIMDPQEDFADR
jgi:hypothetical protein